MRFEFHPDALAEYEEASRHYATCQAGLEFRLIQKPSLRAKRSNPECQPNQWPLDRRVTSFLAMTELISSALTRVFPYAILYTSEPDHVLIIAVMHSHREPGYWRKRLA